MCLKYYSWLPLAKNMAAVIGVFFPTSLLFLELYTFDTKSTYYFDSYKNHRTLKL